jgi:hypothetical protein
MPVNKRTIGANSVRAMRCRRPGHTGMSCIESWISLFLKKGLNANSWVPQYILHVEVVVTPRCGSASSRKPNRGGFLHCLSLLKILCHVLYLVRLSSFPPP